MSRNLNELAQRVEAAKVTRARMLRMERRVSAWHVGWILIVIAAFIARALQPTIITWQIVAYLAAGQSAILALLLLINYRKWSATMNIKIAEEEALGGGVDARA